MNHITKEELAAYTKDGYLLKPAYFSPDEVLILKSQVQPTFLEDTPRRIVESNGLVRSVYGSHKHNDIFGKLVRHPKLLEPVTTILKNEVYVYQFKINAKAAMGGDIWEWHQDFIFWKKEDGLQNPDIINATIFLDDVTEFNGPITFIPGSHKIGMVDVESSSRAMVPDGAPEWISNLSAQLKYSLNRKAMEDMASTYGLVAPKGPAGSLLLFDPNVFHCSGANMSPFDRAVIILTYNSIVNVPHAVECPRPDFLASRDHQPLKSLDYDGLTR
jgi:ectoine hydroxylase